MREYDFKNIRHVENGRLYYWDESRRPCEIDLKRSGLLWWDKHGSASLLDRLLCRRRRNRFVGERCRTSSCGSITLYAGDETVRFILHFPENAAGTERRTEEEKWVAILNQFTSSGCWLFDEG